MITKELEESSGLNMYNGLLKDYKMNVQIGVRHDKEYEDLEPNLYEVYVTDGKNDTPMTNGLTEEELADVILETFNELVRHCYVVTYVGLSDSDADANGYCAAIVYANRKIAEDKVMQLIEEELNTHDEDINVRRENGKIVISWAGGTERVLISIHETRKEWV